MSADMLIAGSDLPPRDSTMTDELPTITVKFERTPWDPTAAAAWKNWQEAPQLGPEPVSSRPGPLDRISGWLCERLPERALTAIAWACAWADGHEQAPRQPEPYRETYRPARYVGCAAPIQPRRYISAPWLIARLWNEQDGIAEPEPLDTPVGTSLTGPHAGLENYVGSHRRGSTPGSSAQRERSTVEAQHAAIRSATRDLDLRDRAHWIQWVMSSNHPARIPLDACVPAFRIRVEPAAFALDNDRVAIRIASVA